MTGGIPSKVIMRKHLWLKVLGMRKKKESGVDVSRKRYESCTSITKQCSHKTVGIPKHRSLKE